MSDVHRNPKACKSAVSRLDAGRGTVEGIGRVLAGRIIAGRPYWSVEDLLGGRGIEAPRTAAALELQAAELGGESGFPVPDGRKPPPSRPTHAVALRN